MHIGFRTSGGRGEYELVGGASGYVAANLDGWSFFMRWPDGVVRDTGLIVNPGDSGKPRLRSQASPQYQVGRMMAAMLLLPEPIRDRSKIEDGLPVVRRAKYIINQIGFAPDVSFAPAVETVEFSPNFVECKNVDSVELIGVAARYRRIAAVHAASSSLPASLVPMLDVHRTALDSGSPIDGALNRVVSDLCTQMTIVCPSYIDGEDPLPSLERAAGLSTSVVPELPPPDEIGEEDITVRTASASEWRQSRTRGASGRRFSKRVRVAYGNRCAFCGVRLAGISGLASGIDAAHILAWSAYDLDVVRNGIALCKTHHWAFDASILVPTYESGIYRMRFTNVAQALDEDARRHLGADGDAIPTERLPADPRERPDPRYLERLYADLELAFLGR